MLSPLPVREPRCRNRQFLFGSLTLPSSVQELAHIHGVNAKPKR